ncbi:MAG: DUF1080 domain-containing protein [Planctomycetia bacterium]|nr:DUF1080 domain-containing protein [Planctomycetia bacterium]
MNRRLFLALPAAFALCASLVSQSVFADDPNTLTEAETKAGFAAIFDGKTLEGWDQSGNWKVADGVVTREGKGGSLTYTKQKMPDDFELRFQWKVAKGSNSGVYYRPGQYEYQVLDNAVHNDGKNPRTSAASIYFGFAPSVDNTKPVGEWNEGRIVCKGTVIQHWLNGKAVVDIDYADPKWAKEVEILKIRGGDLPSRGANLNLQDHGDPVWYRGIKLRTIPADEKVVASSDYAPAAIPDAMKAKEKAYLEQRAKAAEKK